MTHVQSLPDAYAKDPASIDKAKLVECIQACFDCAQTCTVCADAYLSEDVVAELDCVDICSATGKILSRHGNNDAAITHAVLEACRTAYKACAAECGQHARMHRH